MTATLQPATAKKVRPANPVAKKSRAVLRDVEPGSTVDCSHCGERVKFQAKVRNKQVICNIYRGRKWKRVEHFHYDCYEEAGSPYGVAEAKLTGRQVATAAAAERSKRLTKEAQQN